jgi:hypothetical protein
LEAQRAGDVRHGLNCARERHVPIAAGNALSE